MQGALSTSGNRHRTIKVEQALTACETFYDSGKQRHPAALNYSDCFAYALAKTAGEPLLSKGAGFKKTDIPPAL